jgi:hypothetical protein
MKVGLIVEGHGEERALPILLRRLLQQLDPQFQCAILPPFRISRGQLVKDDGLQRAVEHMARKVGEDGRILILLDADDDLPCQLGPHLLARAKEFRKDRDISVVVAMREYEAWFLAAAESLRGQRTLPLDLTPPPRPEDIRGAKDWLGQYMVDGYRETLDQPAFTQRFDLTEARRSDSFDKLVRDVGRLFGLPVPPRPTPLETPDP